MKVSLIGMSGSGKSFWAKRLEAAGFRRFCIDDMIEARLDHELESQGFAGIHDVAQWMGQPFDDRYAANSAHYLQLEAEALQDVLQTVEHESDAKDMVIDTTGSVVYASAALLKRLAACSHVVYLEISAADKEALYDLFLKDPKPVVWGDVFTQEAAELPAQALARCYPLLLDSRAKRYAALADVTIPAPVIQGQPYSAPDFISLLRVRG